MNKKNIPAVLRVLSGGPYQKPALPFPWCFRPPDHPSAAALRDTYRLLKVAGEGADFARARRLKSWVRRQWNHGYSGEGDQETRSLDALDILARAQQGQAFACWYYRRTLVQACLAVGLPARELGICRQGADFPDGIRSNTSHAVAEVYCRELRKWVMLDADANAFYTIAGVPAGALEVHYAWLKDRGRTVRQVLDKPRFVYPTFSPVWDAKALARVWRDFTRHRSIDYYEHLFTHTVNGYADPPRKVGQKFLWYVGRRPPLLLMDYYGNDLDRFLFVEEEAHFNWPLQRTFVLASMQKGPPSGRLEVRLEHTMPFFDHFELSLAGRPFNRVRGERLTVSLPAGKTLCRARCVDTFGRSGTEAALLVELKPASPALLARRAAGKDGA
jgi:hypothetical protein